MAFLMKRTDYHILLDCAEKCGDMLDYWQTEVDRLKVVTAVAPTPARVIAHCEAVTELKAYRREMRRIQRAIQWEDTKMELHQLFMRLRRRLGGLI